MSQLECGMRSLFTRLVLCMYLFKIDFSGTLRQDIRGGRRGHLYKSVLSLYTQTDKGGSFRPQSADLFRCSCELCATHSATPFPRSGQLRLAGGRGLRS